MHIHRALVLHPFVSSFFFFKASYQFTPLLNLCLLVFSPVLFGWFVSIYIRLFPEGIIICDLYPIFQQHILGLNKILVCIPTFICSCLCICACKCVHIIWGQMGKHTYILFNSENHVFLSYRFICSYILDYISF
jgi:hypothetical protein